MVNSPASVGLVRSMRLRVIGGLMGCAIASSALAQHVPAPHGASATTNFVMPNARHFAAPQRMPVITIDKVNAEVTIVELSAATTLDITMRNNSDRQEEAVLLIPVPAGSAISSFMFEGVASEPTVEILAKDEARRVYDSIVASVRDPALLEFAGHNLVRSSVFPVAARATQRVRLTYEHLLESNGSEGTRAYMLPRTQSLEHRVPWTIAVDVRGRDPIAGVYSPTHELLTERVAANHLKSQLAPHATTEPGPLRLFVLREKGDLSATLMAYPDPTIGGGYFLLAAGLPAEALQRSSSVKRDVTIVLDRSGSMVGEKMEQARRALMVVLDSLEEGESFNIIDFGTTVTKFADRPVTKNAQSLDAARQYVQKLAANGGTNTFAALHEALRQEAPSGSLPMVLFLTDGLPTIGRTTEYDIRALVEKGNASRKRVYTFGVGHDVNAPLLDRLADATRGVATYVQPKEDVAAAVATTVRKLRGPVFMDLGVAVMHADKSPAPRVLADLQPAIIPDLFQGDQLVLLGRYTSEERVVVRLSGTYLGTPRAFDIAFDLGSASTRNDFVPRLWATRRIAQLIDTIRQQPGVAGAAPSGHVEGIIAEIVALSTKFGILTEYTSFLARDGTNLNNTPELITACRGNLEARAVGERWGAGAFNQSLNYNSQKGQSSLKNRNDYIDESMQRVEFNTVQQVADCALYNRAGKWIDSRIAQQQEEQPTRVVVLGSEEHRQLVDELVQQGRQALIAMPGEVLLLIKGERVLVINTPAN